MNGWQRTTRRAAPKRPPGELRIRLFQVVVALSLGAVAGRLFALQVLSHRFYSSLASNQHGIFEDLFPTRGAIFSSRFPTFHQLDLRVDKNILFESWTLDVYLDVQNVYNAQNVEASFTDYRSREEVFVPGIPIFPVLGLKGSF